VSDEILKEFDIPPSLGNYFEGMADEIIRLRARLAAAERQLEVERMRLAACGVAALGYFEGCADEYRSASLDDVLRLHARLAAAERDATRYRYIRDNMVSAEWYIPFMRDDVWVRLKAFDRREAYYSTLDEAVDALATHTTTEDV